MPRKTLKQLMDEDMEKEVLVTMSKFEELRKIDVSEHVEKKNGLSYLSWAWAVDTLLLKDPNANWCFNEPKSFGDSLMVSCSVTAFEKTMTCHLPVLDYRNKAIPNPDAFQVNTAMQRCLVKCIALHGIGLYIYAGEDLPEDAKKAEDEKISIEQKTYFLELLKKTGVSYEDFCKKNSLVSIDNLTVKKMNELIPRMQKYVQEQGEK